MKIYKKGNYIYLINASGDIKQDHANEVKITKTNVANETYSIYSDDLGVNYVTFAELTQENGTAYASVQAWELWYAQNTGFNPASGGSGAGTVINTTTNFASLPDPTLVSNDFYWVSNTQGYRILGTYKSNGLYYSNGTTWEYIDAPTTATQSEVNTGTLTDKYLTPSTFENASKWTTKMDANVSINALNDVTITDVINGQILQYNFTTSQWENVSVTIGNGDMQKATYDIDNDGIVDYAETIPVTVRNPSATETLRRGTIVYLSGSTGYRPNAYKARANAESTSSGTFGSIISDIAPNSDGLVASMGTLHNLDTRDTAPYPFTADVLVDGDALWLDPNNDGYVTKTKPQAPNHIVFIGIVARTSPTLGRIVYRIVNGFELDELHNVKIDSLTLANNDIIQYNSSTSLWENKQISTSGGSFIPQLPITSYPQGYYANNGSATMSVMGNVSAVTVSGTAALQSITGTNTLTRTVRISVPTASTVGSKAGIRTATLRHSVGQGFLFSVCWAIQDAAYVAGAKQFHGLLPITTLSTISNTVDVSSLINFVGVGSDATDLNLQVFYNDATGVASKIDLGSNFPANRTAGAVMNNVYVFEMYNEPNTTTVKYRITERSSGLTAQGEITTDLPTADILLASQSIRTNGATALATITQWQHLIGYIL